MSKLSRRSSHQKSVADYFAKKEIKPEVKKVNFSNDSKDKPVATVPPQRESIFKSPDFHTIDDDDDDDDDDFINFDLESVLKDPWKPTQNSVKEKTSINNELMDEEEEVIAKRDRKRPLCIESSDEEDINSTPNKRFYSSIQRELNSNNHLFKVENCRLDNVDEVDFFNTQTTKNEEPLDPSLISLPQLISSSIPVETLNKVIKNSPRSSEKEQIESQNTQINKGTPKSPVLGSYSKLSDCVKKLPITPKDSKCIPQPFLHPSLLAQELTVDQILKHPVLRVCQLENEDLTILLSLKSALVKMMMDIFLQFPTEELNKISGYDVDHHIKIVNAFKKITLLLSHGKNPDTSKFQGSFLETSKQLPNFYKSEEESKSIDDYGLPNIENSERIGPVSSISSKVTASAPLNQEKLNSLETSPVKMNSCINSRTISNETIENQNISSSETKKSTFVFKKFINTENDELQNSMLSKSDQIDKSTTQSLISNSIPCGESFFENSVKNESAAAIKPAPLKFKPGFVPPLKKKEIETNNLHHTFDFVDNISSSPSPSTSKDTSCSNFTTAVKLQKSDFNHKEDNFKEELDDFDDFDELSKCDFDDVDDDVPLDSLANCYPSKELGAKPNEKALLLTPKKAKFRGTVQNDGPTGEFSSTNYSHSKRVYEIFTQTFGLKTFRENQKEVINAALLSHDCFVLMPTGGGKSLCYQLPACLLEGLTCVISPLKSLIQDQVQKMVSLDIPCSHLSGDVTSKEENAIYTELMKRDPKMKLLYVTPEKVSASQRFLNLLEALFQRKKLSMFVVDEAHCVSHWGHDFRPDYKKLNVLRTKFPGVPMMALTATATPRVRVDILHQLGLKTSKWFLSSFNRANLKYEVVPKKGKKTATTEMAALIKARYRDQCGIIYCLSRKECDSVASDLNFAGISATSYHAGLTDKQRSGVQIQWSNDQVKIVCATIAFGMGIDKPDVRFVFHYSLPKSVEGYYQESGRAGRDGENATCVLFYSYQDMHRIRKMIDMDKENWEAKKTHYDNLFRMVAYCENKTDCRRYQLLSYFGEIFNREECRKSVSTMCDNCKTQDSFIRVDVTKEARIIVQGVSQLCRGGRWTNSFTLTHIIDIFKGSENKKIIENGHNKNPLHGAGRSWSRNDAERLGRRLVLEGYLMEELVLNRDDIANAYVRLGEKASQFLSDSNAKIEFEIMKTNNESRRESIKEETEEEKELKQLENMCHLALVDAVKRLAAERGVRHTNAINPVALRIMAKNMPESEEEMRNVPHITQANFEKYGKVLLDITQGYAAQKIVLQSQLEDEAAFKEETRGEQEDNDDDEGWLNSISAPSMSGSPYFAGSKRSRGRGRGRGYRFRGGKRKRFFNSQPKKIVSENYRVKVEKRGRGGAALKDKTKLGSSSLSKPKLGLLSFPKPRAFLPNPKVTNL